MSSKVLTARQMQEVDRVTIEKLGVPGTLLMEHAGEGVVRLLEEKFPRLSQERIVVLCGKGNNGGDGFVVARLLRARGLSPAVMLLADPQTLKGDALSHYRLLVERAATPLVVCSAEDWAKQRETVANATLIVDAIFGTGLTRPVEGLAREVIQFINANCQATPLVAVDIPSGLSSDFGEPLGDSLRAGYTVTFTAPKWGHVLPPSYEQVGELRVVQIGTPASVYESDPSIHLNLVGPEDLAPFVAARKRESHKGSYGHVLVAGGSRGKSGAAALAALGALRVGAGLTTVATAASAQPVVAAASPVIMTEALQETEAGTISLRAFDYGRFASVVAGKTVLAVGPGLSTNAETVDFVRRVVKEAKNVPMVLDADGLNAFSDATDLLDGAGRALVLTPHPGEMSRLTGRSTPKLDTKAVQSNRVQAAREFAMSHHLVLVLKGNRTLVAAPDGQVYVNPTGNPGMAKGGSGDVLTGMIAGLLAQHPEAPVEKVVCAAVYWHGAAGDVAAQRCGELSMLATDLLDALPQVLRDSASSG